MSVRGIGIYNEDTFTTKEDLVLYKENITRILLTSPGERVCNQYFGSRLKNFLFEFDFIMQEEVDNEIRKAINRWEPRVNIIAIKTSRPDERTFHIKLVLEEKQTLERFEYERLIRT